MNSTQELLDKLAKEEIIFTDVIAHIESLYTHIPTAFKNGEATNAITENQGSAKVLAFAKLNNLSQEDTLTLFAEHYRAVLGDPEGSNHQNIRQFQAHGWNGVSFESEALANK